MSANQIDTALIKDMKTKMLAKLKTRYTPDQMKSLKTCTFLDIRYKTCNYVANDFGQLEKDVKEILGNHDQSQQEIHEIVLFTFAAKILDLLSQTI